MAVVAIAMGDKQRGGALVYAAMGGGAIICVVTGDRHGGRTMSLLDDTCCGGLNVTQM